MTTTRHAYERREFLGALAASAVAACVPSRSSDTSARPPSEPAPGPDAPPSTGSSGAKTVLVLGGTKFLGPHFVRAARDRGFTLTLFNRGKTAPEMFADLEQLRGDRDGDLSALRGRKWDAVLDTSAFVPRRVRASAELLADNVGQYVFISSVSAYGNLASGGIDESADTASLPDPNTEDMQHYGGLKAACEREAEAVFPGRTTRVRPGLIVGPLDPTDRFTYWPVRLDRGGDVLAPGTPADPLQFIDARDLANFLVDTLERELVGIYNTVGPEAPVPIGSLLKTCQEVAGTPSTLHWAPAEFLEAQEVTPWQDMPVWVPPSDAEYGGMAQVSGAKAVAAGLRFRPTHEIVADTLAWWKTLPAERRASPQAGLTAERETAVLATLGKLKAANAGR